MIFKGYSFKEIDTSSTSHTIRKAIIIILFLSLLVGGCLLFWHLRESSRIFGYYRVSRVIDGDTIEVDKDGESVRVRLIGVDTPETVDPDEPVGCYGPEASDYVKNELYDKFVKIEIDPSQDKYDIYNRLLAYVFTDTVNFNKELIEKGYAREYTYDKPYKYQDEFKEAEKKARKEELGLWSPSICPANSENSSAQGSKENSSAQSQNCDIKGNISYYTGEKIYHVRGQEDYEKTEINEEKGERWFCSEEEAVAAGWRRAKK